MPEKTPPQPAGSCRALLIDHVGQLGDGRAREAGSWVSVPFTLAGETVEVSGEGPRLRAERILAPSPERSEPSCRHFGTCGGCALQHMNPQAGAAFKRGLILRALAAQGLEADVAPSWVTPPFSRRRAGFHARAGRGKPVAGFHGRRSHDLVEISECPLLRPALLSGLNALRPLLQSLPAGGADAVLLVTETDTGLDLYVSGPAASASSRQLDRFLSGALAAGFARVTLAGGDPLCLRPVRISIGRASLLPPPGGFLQASRAAEDEMARIVLEHLEGTHRGLDLFSGCGTFSLRMAERFPVHAAEASPDAVRALLQAARAASGLSPVTAETRDLFRNPLSPPELARFDGAVLNPPRAGGLEQARQVAVSGLRRVAYVSCDPVTLARDLAVLVAGGWRLGPVFPIDQFLWSAHVEAVALLEKP